MLAEVFHRRLAVHAGAAGAAKDQRDHPGMQSQSQLKQALATKGQLGQGLPGSSSARLCQS